MVATTKMLGPDRVQILAGCLRLIMVGLWPSIYENMQPKKKQPIRRPNYFNNLALTLLISAMAVGLQYCHRIPDRQSSDRTLNQAFLTPEATFHTWVKATLERDLPAIKNCYWSGLGKLEMDSWMIENLRPAARAYFRGAELMKVRYRSPVEANFSFRLGQSPELGHGVMVRTRQGWKIQSW